MPIGTVKFFNENKGYGFIAPDEGGQDAFVHITAVESAGMNSLRENQRVAYDLEPDRRGKMAATNLRAADEWRRAAQRPIRINRPRKARRTAATRNNSLSAPIARSSNLQFFLARAAQAHEEAEAATLDHVRERCRRSEAAWSALADRAQRSEELREAEAVRKADEGLKA